MSDPGRRSFDPTYTGGWKQTLAACLHHRYCETFIATLIVISVALVIWEASLPLESVLAHTLWEIGNVIVAVFVLELFLRWLIASSTLRFLRHYWLDVLSVLPVLRSLRMLRVLRILRLLRLGMVLNRRMHLLRASLYQGLTEYILLIFVVSTLLLVTTLSIHWIEGGNKDFAGLDQAFWWSLHSLMAGEPVGGEPDSTGGKIITAMVMLGNVTMFAVLTGLVSAHMVESLRQRMDPRFQELDDLTDHIVLAGNNRTAPVIVEQMHHDPRYAETPVVVIAEEVDPEPFVARGCRRELLHFLVADYTRADVLRQAGLERAQMAILLADSSKRRSDQDRDARTVLAAMLIERLRPGIFTCAQLLNPDNASHLKLCGVEEVVVADEYAGQIMAAAGRARGLVALVDEVFSSQHGNHIFKLEVPASWVGKRYVEALEKVKSRTGALLISIEKRGAPMMVNPPHDYVFLAGDIGVFLAREDPGRLSGPQSLAGLFTSPG